MYTLNPTAIGVPKGLNKRWAQVDLDEPTVQSLFLNYRALQIEVTPEDAIEPVYFLLHELSEEFMDFTGTVQDLLDDHFDEDALPTFEVAVAIDRAVARFYDVFQLRYAIKAVDATNAEPPLSVDIEDVDHLRIERRGASFNSATAVKQVLANVNGFYHLTKNVGDKGLFVQDGFKCARISGQNQLGLWDFQELGELEVVSPVPGQLYSSNNAYQVTFTQDLSDKTVFFFIAGYFFPVDGIVVSQIGPQNFLIDFAHESMRLAARYFEAVNYLDLSDVQAAANGETAGTIDTELLGSPDAIEAWMGLSQTFAVILDRKDCYIEQRHIKRTGNPNMYQCFLERELLGIGNEVNNPRLTTRPPQLPLVLELGRQPPYWTQTERWVHTLTIYSNRIGQLLNETGQPAEQVLTSGADQPGSPGLVQHAYLLEFGSSIQNSPP